MPSQGPHTIRAVLPRLPSLCGRLFSVRASAVKGMMRKEGRVAILPAHPVPQPPVSALGAVGESGREGRTEGGGN